MMFSVKNSILPILTTIKISISYIMTHPKVYVALFELQLFFLVSDSVVMITNTANLPFIFEITCFFSLIHGMFGIYTIIEDYIFNNLVKKILLILKSYND